MKNITRFAPSPTGDLHIGSARTAYFNWLAARASGGAFYLRIDDTDAKRNDPAYTQVILEVMKWLGLDYDRIAYQSNNFPFYKSHAEQLVNYGMARVSDGAIVLSFNPDGENIPDHWVDEIKGKIRISPADVKGMDGMVLIKSDGSPAYNFCSVMDDIWMGVNFIIRGVDHITNTSKQVLLWDLARKAFLQDKDAPSGDLPRFAHLGLICLDNKPLSKRDSASSMLKYMKAGYDADAMLNYLARQGWGPTVDDKSTSMLPREKMLEMFLTSGKMRSQPASFDIRKLESFDRKYKAQKGIWRTKETLT